MMRFPDEGDGAEVMLFSDTKNYCSFLVHQLCLKGTVLFLYHPSLSRSDPMILKEANQLCNILPESLLRQSQQFTLASKLPLQHFGQLSCH